MKVSAHLMYLVLLLSALFSHASLAQMTGDDELLPPEKAFALTATLDQDELNIHYAIAPGYYMYRDAFQFELKTEGVSFGDPSAPDGKIKHDEFFGEVEIYRDAVSISLPVDAATALPPIIEIVAAGQGCADIGVCYPPLYQLLTVDTSSAQTVYPTAYQFKPMNAQTIAPANDNLAATDTPAMSNDDPLALLQALGDDIGLDDEDEIPEPDKAFQLAAIIDSNNILQTEIKIYPHTYLYRDKIKLGIVDGSGHVLAPLSLPTGDTKNDEFFGEMEVYHDFLPISVALQSESDASDTVVIEYGYQGCVEDKICYPPIKKYLSLNLADRSVAITDEPPVAMQAGAASTSAETTTDSQSEGMTAEESSGSEQDKFANLLKDASVWSIFLFFLAGVGLTFTPCVFPMIPILSGIIAGQGENLTTRKAFTLSLVYVLAMATTYAVAGAIVGRFGAEFNIQIWFQDPVILSVFAGIFVLLSLSMFGFYDLQMPSFIQSRLTEISNRQQGGNLIGVGIMGLLSALIVGPCITAPLVGALIFISQTQDAVLGGLALFALGLGMGMPLLLIGTTAGNLLPRAGTWMDAVKGVFGVGLLAVAIWLLERIMPTAVTMLLMSILIIISAVYMGAVDRLPDGASGWRKLWKGVGIILLVYGLFYLYGVAAGSKDLIQPLKGLQGKATVSAEAGTAASSEHVVFQQIKGESGLKQLLDSAKGQPVMLDFYADWCISCKEMEKYAFTHPEVLSALQDYLTVQTDVTDNDREDQMLMKSLGIFGPPAILFFDKQGHEIPDSRVVGEMSGPEFAAHINRFTAKL